MMYDQHDVSWDMRDHGVDWPSLWLKAHTQHSNNMADSNNTQHSDNTAENSLEYIPRVQKFFSAFALGVIVNRTFERCSRCKCSSL